MKYWPDNLFKYAFWSNSVVNDWYTVKYDDDAGDGNNPEENKVRDDTTPELEEDSGGLFDLWLVGKMEDDDWTSSGWDDVIVVVVDGTDAAVGADDTCVLRRYKDIWKVYQTAPHKTKDEMVYDCNKCTVWLFNVM